MRSPRSPGQTLKSQVAPIASPPPSTTEYGPSLAAAKQPSTFDTLQANSDVSPSLMQSQTAPPSQMGEEEIAAAQRLGVASSALLNGRATSGNAIGQGRGQGLGDVDCGVGARPVPAVRSVRSAGSDRLQQLAILEMKLREEGAQATTTGLVSVDEPERGYRCFALAKGMTYDG